MLPRVVVEESAEYPERPGGMRGHVFGGRALG